MENFICNQYGETYYLNTEIINIYGWITQVRGDINAMCLHFLPYLLNIYQKIEFLIPEGSVATCLRWGG